MARLAEEEQNFGLDRGFQSSRDSCRRVLQCDGTEHFCLTASFKDGGPTLENPQLDNPQLADLLIPNSLNHAFPDWHGRLGRKRGLRSEPRTHPLISLMSLPCVFSLETLLFEGAYALQTAP